MKSRPLTRPLSIPISQEAADAFCPAGLLTAGPRFVAACRRSATKPCVVSCAAGPPNWVPWGGSHGRMVDSERDDLMMRELCKNCRGSGNMACRKCHGKGVFQLRSRALRSSSDALAADESLCCDPKTGLWRAVEQCGCPACERKGVIRCAVCFGTGKRSGNTSLRSFRSVLHIAFADNSRDAQASIYSHRVCPAGDSGSQAAAEHAQLRNAQMIHTRMIQTSTDTQAAVANFDLRVPGEHVSPHLNCLRISTASF